MRKKRLERRRRRKMRSWGRERSREWMNCWLWEKARFRRWRGSWRGWRREMKSEKKSLRPIELILNGKYMILRFSWINTVKSSNSVNQGSKSPRKSQSQNAKILSQEPEKRKPTTRTQASGPQSSPASSTTLSTTKQFTNPKNQSTRPTSISIKNSSTLRSQQTGLSRTAPKTFGTTPIRQARVPWALSSTWSKAQDKHPDRSTGPNRDRAINLRRCYRRQNQPSWIISLCRNILKKSNGRWLTSIRSSKKGLWITLHKSTTWPE